MDLNAREYATRAGEFVAEVHRIFAVHENSPSRVVHLDESYTKLKQLSLKQDELMRQGMRCVEQGLFRAAHVMAWAAFMDFYEEVLASDGLTALRSARPVWNHASTIEELREYQTESALLDLAQPLHLATKNEMKALQGLLNKRNQCAHPSSYVPDLNAALGYVSDVLHYVGLLKGKSPTFP